MISPWLQRFASRIPAGGTVLDLACGGGRHTRYLLERGHQVVAVDVDTTGIEDLRGRDDLEIVEADLENQDWPFAGRLFDAIVVTNYLHRPLLPLLPQHLSHLGVIIYDTFAVGNEAFGRPTNPDYLLEPRELLDAFSTDLVIVAYEHGEVSEPRPAIRQRICAMKWTP